ncbi:MAG: MarR family transcriptional regulator [Alphaproteobacteria bacterium]|nr:MarR family transcriptional regulator [Alphaproteobacteria bacterium]
MRRSRRTSLMPNEVLEQQLDLDRFLPYRLSVLSNRVSDAIAAHYSERFGLTIAEWRVMAVLGGSSGLSAREVAERTAMDKVQVSRAVASLVDVRRVTKQDDANDGRITRLSLSAKGKAIYDEIVPLALHLEAVLLAALTKDERKTLSELMDKLAGRIGSLSASAT